MTDRRSRAPLWFTMVALVLVLWGVAGGLSFYMHIRFDPDAPGPASAADRAIYRSLPAWLTIVFAVAVTSGVVGAVAMVMRLRLALPLFTASLAAIVVQFGWTFAMTDMLALKGAAATVPAPLVIGGIALIQIWLARHAERRGWIG